MYKSQKPSKKKNILNFVLTFVFMTGDRVESKILPLEQNKNIGKEEKLILVNLSENKQNKAIDKEKTVLKNLEKPQHKRLENIIGFIIVVLFSVFCHFYVFNTIDKTQNKILFFICIILNFLFFLLSYIAFFAILIKIFFFVVIFIFLSCYAEGEIKYQGFVLFLFNLIIYILGLRHYQQIYKKPFFSYFSRNICCFLFMVCRIISTFINLNRSSVFFYYLFFLQKTQQEKLKKIISLLGCFLL